MNELAATSLPAALRACMETGCGRDIDSHDFSEPWSQKALAEQIGVSDRLIRKWLKGDSQPTLDNFDQLLVVMTPKPCPRQEAAYARLRSSRPPPSVTRRPSRTATGANPAPLTPIPPDARPYRGLEAFREEDAHLFFGRDALAQNVLDKLAHHRLVLLIGASGSGKSSLINAGILPKLRDDPDRTIVRCTPGDRAIANLASALARAIEPDRSPAELLPAQHTYRKQLEADPEAIRDIAQLLPEGRLFLVIDQFEESFTLTRPANPRHHDALIASLLAIARSPDERRLNALLSMRSDFQNELETADPMLIQRLDNAMVQMRAMLPAEREAAITEPARAYGVTMEPGLLTAITTDLADNRDALPLLEVALDELWSRRDGTNRRLTLAAFTEIGGIPGALGQRAGNALEHLGLDETLVRRLFLGLVRVDPEGASTKSTRRPRTRHDLGEELWQLGERLTAPGLRLLVTYRDDTTGEQILDVTHEAIFRHWRRLAGWIEDEREVLLFRQRLDQRMADFDENDCNPDFFLPRAELYLGESLADEYPDAFEPAQTAFIVASADHWAENRADREARTLWARLELSFGNGSMPDHDKSALIALWDVEPETSHRFLLLGIDDADASRKFSRMPSLVVHAALGLDPVTACDRASAALRTDVDVIQFDAVLGWIYIARQLSPLLGSLASQIAVRALHFVEWTDVADHVLVVAKAIASIDRHLGAAMARDAAGRTVDRALNLADQLTEPEELTTLAEVIAALACQLDATKAHEAAGRVVLIALDFAKRTADSVKLQSAARTIAVLARHLDSATVGSILASALDLAHGLAKPTSNPDKTEAVAEILAALAGHLDAASAWDAAERIVALALKPDRTKASQLQCLTKAIDALAARLEAASARIFAQRTVDRALNIAERTTRHYELSSLAHAIGSLLCWLDPETAGDVAGRTVARVLAASPGSLLMPREPATAIAAVAEYLDAVAAAGAITQTFDLAETNGNCMEHSSIVSAISVLSGRVDADTAQSIVGRLDRLAEQITSPGDLRALAEAISALSGKLDVETACQTAGRTVARVLECVEQPTDNYSLRSLAHAIAALASQLDAATACNAAVRTVVRALDNADETARPDEFRALTETLSAVVGSLPSAPATFASIELLKHPLGGDGKATWTLIFAIVFALDRPDLLSPFPEQSFWAVMQHLAELKAANPDWDWLDLARPPLPPDKLVATFRRLCADPPPPAQA